MAVQGLYLNGRQVQTPGAPIEVNNPADGQVVGRITTIDRAGVKQAFRDAEAALAEWRSLTAQQRGQYLHAIADELQRRTHDIAKIITQENGKPLAQSKGEVAMSADHLHWFAEEARRAYGRIIPQQATGKRNLVIRRPIGVVGAISPWNFPLVLAVRKVAPALAAGCPVVLKPASYTPLCAAAFAECVHAAELPPGVFQMVLGSAREIGDEMLTNPICRKITFTGSTEVGRKLIAGAAEQVKPLSLELGGHAPVLVFDDADLEKAVEGVMIAKFRNIGQSCIAANRIYVQRGILKDFTAALVEKTKALNVGNGLDDGVDIGPLIDSDALDSALGQIKDAQERGATIACGGKRWGEVGSFLEPTVLTDVPDDAQCMKVETFAPVAPISGFDTEDEVLHRANDSIFGLAAYLFTSNLDRAFRVIDQLEAGTIGVNDGAPSTSNAPFGGVKQSGWGRELGSEGLDGFLETKHASFGGVD